MGEVAGSTITEYRHKRLRENDDYRRAFEMLREGGIVAMPTDTVYGLVAVAGDRHAVERVYEAKGRDFAQPLPIFVGSMEQAEIIGETDAAAARLAERFWPGALTIVLRKRASYRTAAAEDSETIGLRAPADAVLREMALQLGPLTGTSANMSGGRECRSAAEVREQLGDLVDFVVDAEVDASGEASTVVDASEPGSVRIVREGPITRAMIEEALAGIAEVG